VRVNRGLSSASGTRHPLTPVSAWLDRWPAARTARGHGESDLKVRDHRLARLQQDVRGFDVAVDGAMRVRVLQRLGHVRRDAHRLVDRKLVLAVEPIA